MGDFVLAGHEYFLVRGPHGEITNSWIEEDASPTALQSAEGAPDAASVPTATVEYNSFGGNIGLDSRVRAPGDFTRFYQSDWDATRGTQANSWVRWDPDTVPMVGGSGVVIPGRMVTATLSFTLRQQAIALIDDPIYMGFISTNGLDPTHGEVYKWDSSLGQFTFIRQVNAPQPNYASTFLSGQPGPSGTPGQYYLSISQPVVMHDGGRWYADLNGHARNAENDTDASTTVTNTCFLTPFYDFVAIFSYSTMDAYVNAQRPMGTMVQYQQGSVTGSGVSAVINTIPVPTQGTLSGQSAIFGAVSCEGVLWVSTLNGIWGVQWSDEYNILRVEELVRSLRVTGPPVNWNEEVYVPCGNRLAHIKPGQGPPDFIKLDQFDTMLPPFNGRIVEAIPTTDALYCRVVEEGALTSSIRAAVVRFDASGAWSCVYPDMNATSTLARMPLVKTSDPLNPPGIGMFVDSTHIRLLPAQDSGRNPRTMLVTSRKQRPVVRGVSPWETGQAVSNQKQVLRARLQVEDCYQQSIKLYYQLRSDTWSGAANTFTDGSAANTGAWHLCCVCQAGNWGAYGSLIDPYGNGWLWVEFDGMTSWPGGVGVLPLYPDNTEVRWCIEINGDPTGTYVPMLRGFRTDREEYLSKTKVITARIDLSSTLRRAGVWDDEDSTDALRDENWVAQEMQYLEGLMSGKRAQLLVSPKVNPDTGQHYQYYVEISKWQETLHDFDYSGVQAAGIQLSMKVLPLLDAL